MPLRRTGHEGRRSHIAVEPNTDGGAVINEATLRHVPAEAGEAVSSPSSARVDAVDEANAVWDSLHRREASDQGASARSHAARKRGAQVHDSEPLLDTDASGHCGDVTPLPQRSPVHEECALGGNSSEAKKAHPHVIHARDTPVDTTAGSSMGLVSPPIRVEQLGCDGDVAFLYGEQNSSQKQPQEGVTAAAGAADAPQHTEEEHTAQLTRDTPATIVIPTTTGTPTTSGTPTAMDSNRVVGCGRDINLQSIPTAVRPLLPRQQHSLACPDPVVKRITSVVPHDEPVPAARGIGQHNLH